MYFVTFLTHKNIIFGAVVIVEPPLLSFSATTTMTGFRSRRKTKTPNQDEYIKIYMNKHPNIILGEL